MGGGVGAGQVDDPRHLARGVRAGAGATGGLWEGRETGGGRGARSGQEGGKREEGVGEGEEGPSFGYPLAASHPHQRNAQPPPTPQTEHCWSASCPKTAPCSGCIHIAAHAHNRSGTVCTVSPVHPECGPRPK